MTPNPDAMTPEVIQTLVQIIKHSPHHKSIRDVIVAYHAIGVSVEDVGGGFFEIQFGDLPTVSVFPRYSPRELANLAGLTGQTPAELEARKATYTQIRNHITQITGVHPKVDDCPV